ncbi:hypothetical protein Tco_0679762, partial [Tanacetum coccineum]
MFSGVIFIAISIIVCLGTARESSVAGTAGVVTIVGVYGPLRMHFRKASPFGLVSMYRKNRDRHCAYRPVASISARSRDLAAIMLLCIWLSVVEVVIGVVMMND